MIVVVGLVLVRRFCSCCVVALALFVGRIATVVAVFVVRFRLGLRVGVDDADVKDIGLS